MFGRTLYLLNIIINMYLYNITSHTQNSSQLMVHEWDKNIELVWNAFRLKMSRISVLPYNWVPTYTMTLI